MAEVFDRVSEGQGRGKKLTQVIGLHADVQARLALEAKEGAYRAEAQLAIVRSKPGYDIRGGHSFIETSTGDVDHYVILNDERGLRAAMTIEYGRKASDKMADLGGEYIGETVTDGGPTRKNGAMEGLFILHDAMKISRGGNVEAELMAFDE
jgi:hypothetical protein